MSYLTNIPDIQGLPKVLAVRREVIHIKHIFTEIFVRKSIDIEPLLSYLGYSLFDYMEIMTNRIRKVHYFSREYSQICDAVVKEDRDRFFPTIKLMDGLNKLIVLDFDGVITKNNFHYLYELCCEREKTVVCSANPTVNIQRFIDKGLTPPDQIHAMKGKLKKIRRLIELHQKHDYIFYVDNETDYLVYAWIFGMQTYHWDGSKIKYFSLNSK